MPETLRFDCLGHCRDGKPASIARPFCVGCWDALPEPLRVVLDNAEQTRDAAALRYAVTEAVTWFLSERRLIG